MDDTLQRLLEAEVRAEKIAQQADLSPFSRFSTDVEKPVRKARCHEGHFWFF